MKQSFDLWLLPAVTLLAFADFAVIGKCTFDRRMRAESRRMMTIGAEDVVRRLVESRINLSELRHMYEESALAAARSFARIVAEDPSVLKDRARYEALARIVGVDELHVSDSNGVLIASVPATYTGYRMDSSAQSAEFLPAITNRAFALVQKAMKKGSDGGYFQYAGVAREDAPGIVQIGLSPTRVDSAARLADVDTIARTAHIGRDGRAFIRPLVSEDERFGARRGRFTEIWKTENGKRFSALETDCGAFRVTIVMPLYGWALADERPFAVLTRAGYVLAAALIALLVFGTLLRGFRGFLSSCRELFALQGSRMSSRSLAGLSPIFFGALSILLIGLHVAWNLTDDRVLSHARDQLLRGAAEIESDMGEAVDAMLFFIGNAITRHYGTPENLSQNDVKELMARYGIDELNVVNDRGVVLKGDLANVGFDFHSGPTTAEFLCLLTNDWTFAQDFRAAVENPAIIRKYVGVAFPRHNGFVQIGFEKKRMAEEVDFRLRNMATGWTVGESGYFILARRMTGEIVSCGHTGWSEDGSRTLAEVGFDVLNLPEKDDEAFEQTLFGERSLCISRLVGDYHRIVVAIPFSEIDGARDGTVGIVGAILAVVLALAGFMAVWFATANTKLRDFIAEDRRRRSEELENARIIQTESLPVVFPDEPRFGIYARMDTAKEVGGDFYDFYRIPSGRMLFLVADTSGKGIPAAMFMMKAKAVLRACIFEIPELAAAVAEANSRLAENNEANMFVTAWIGAFDPETGAVEYVNAGHNPPLVKAADGSVRWIRSRPCLTLAAMGGVRYRSESISLQPGDSLFLYTDGVTEAMNPAHRQYGEKRLEADLASAPCGKFVEAIRANVAAFTDGAEQSDDITMLALDRRRGRETS